MKYILRFNEIDLNSLAEVGGKGANLGELSRAGFNVPEGFCIGTSFYSVFIDKDKIAAMIGKLDSTRANSEVKQAAEAIREEMMKLDISEALIEELKEVLDDIGIDDSYAVRSSATAEDLKTASFAGQQDTYLNISGFEDIVAAIKKCYASLFNERAVLYRNKNNIPHSTVSMSVIIQKMIPADISGITFTADPISGNREIISIDAGLGLGEALVSGIITPDNYRINKQTGTIASKNIALKEKAIFPSEDGGTQMRKLNHRLKDQEILEDHLDDLLVLAIDLENHYQTPQDIEWCIHNNTIYLLQSRPITSLFPLPEPMTDDGELHAYLSVNHIQVMTDPVSPLGLDIFRNLITFNKQARLDSDYRYTPTAAGRVYLDINKFIASRRIRNAILNILNGMDQLISDSIETFISEKDFDSEAHQKLRVKPSLIRHALALFLKVLYHLLFRDNSNSVDDMNKFIEEHQQGFLKETGKQRSTRELINYINGIPSFVQLFAPNILPVIGSGMLALKILERIEKKEFGEARYTPYLSKGLSGNLTTEMGLQLADLADIVRDSAELQNEFSNPDYLSLIDRIDKLENHQYFRTEFSNFIEKYGFRTSREIDIATERWYENPEALAKNIMTIVNTSEKSIHRTEYAEVIREAETKAEEFISEIRKKSGPLKTRLVRRLIHTLRSNMPIREHHKYALMRQLKTIKELLLIEGDKFVRRNQISHRSDIFWLNTKEIYRYCESSVDLRTLISKRKEDYDHYRKLNPPRLITSEGEIITIKSTIKDLPDNSFSGLAVSSGKTEGIARVILDPNTEVLNKGEILVTKFTDPGWTPLFINAAGVVMEVGGQLTHGSVVAREYGIPAVAGVENACTKIKSGQRIIVDGNNGLVTIIKEEEVQ